MFTIKQSTVNLLASVLTFSHLDTAAGKSSNMEGVVALRSIIIAIVVLTPCSPGEREIA